MPSSNPDRRAAGFSLIEVLVALAIIGLAVAATAGVFGGSLLGHEAAASVDGAVALAEDKIAEAEAVTVLQPGQDSGVFSGRYRWQRVVSPYRDPGMPFESPAAGEAGENVAGRRLLQVRVTVAWHDGRRQRQLALSTLRLTPVPQ